MAVQIKTENALDRFVSDIRELFTKQSHVEARWSALAPVLERLLADPDVVEASMHWPDCVARDGRAENLLFYEDPDFGFTVNALTKQAVHQPRSMRIHHHAHIYTLYGVLFGHEKIERYERVDDGSKSAYAEIRQTKDVDVGPGDIDLVAPYEIHREVSLGERTIAIIIRSQKAGGFNQGRFDVETNTYSESLGPRQMPCEMFATNA